VLQTATHSEATDEERRRRRRRREEGGRGVNTGEV
jgi:hypothetical protein